MNLNELRDIKGASRSKKRVGRGIGSGLGKTAGRGVKGQKSRSGVAINGFEGGQMPLYRRLPKRGFRNPFQKIFNELSLSRIQAAVDKGKIKPDSVINSKMLLDLKIIGSLKNGVRILSDGELTASLVFEVNGASKAAIEKIIKAGGRISFLEKSSNKTSVDS